MSLWSDIKDRVLIKEQFPCWLQHVQVFSHPPPPTPGPALLTDRNVKKKKFPYPMSTSSAYLYHTAHPSSAGEVQLCFPTELPRTALHFYEVQYKGTLMLHLSCSTSSTHSVWNKTKRRGHLVQKKLVISPF